MLTVGVQLSDTVGSVQFTLAPQLPASALTEMSAGQFDITGGMASRTKTVELHVTVLKGSATVSVTMFSPRLEQLKEYLFSVFTNPQYELLPLSTIGTVRLALPEASRYRVTGLQTATGFDAVGPTV
jgi:hypothetical protein